MCCKWIAPIIMVIILLHKCQAILLIHKFLGSYINSFGLDIFVPIFWILMDHNKQIVKQAETIFLKRIIKRKRKVIQETSSTLHSLEMGHSFLYNRLAFDSRPAFIILNSCKRRIPMPYWVKARFRSMENGDNNSNMLAHPSCPYHWINIQQYHNKSKAHYSSSLRHYPLFLDGIYYK